MFCSNCGYKLNGDEKFCTQCGVKIDSKILNVTETVDEQKKEDVIVEKSVNNTNIEKSAENEVESLTIVEETPKDEQPESMVESEQTEEIQETVAQLPKKKKSKIGLLAVLGSISLVLAILLILVAFNFSFAKNLVIKTFTSDETYFKYVHNEQQEVWSEKIADTLVTLKNNSNIPLESQKISITLNSAIIEYIESSIGYDISWLENAEVVFDMASDGQEMDMDAIVNLNGKKIATVNLIVDQGRGRVYYRIPELNNDYLYVSIPTDLVTGTGTAQISDLTGNLPDRETIEELVKKYMSLVIENVEAVEKDNKILEVGELKQKCTKYTVDPNEDQLETIYKAVLKELKKDEVIEEYLKDIAGELNMLSSEVYDSFIEGIDEALDSLDELDPDDLKYSVWIDMEGNIIAWEFADDSDGFSYKAIDDGKKFAKEFILDADGTEFVFRDEGANINGIINSEMVIEYDGDTYFEIERTDYNSEEQTGTITMLFGSGLSSLEGAMFSDVKIKIDLESSNVTIQKGMVKLATIGFSESSKSRISIPSNAYNMDVAADFESYLMKLNFENLFSNMKNAGVPSSLVSELRASLYGTPAKQYQY